MLEKNKEHPIGEKTEERSVQVPLNSACPHSIPGVFFNLPNLQFPPKLWSTSTSNQLPTTGNKILLCGKTSAFSPEQRVSTARRQAALKHVGKTKKKISQTRAGPCHPLHFRERCPHYWRQELKGCCQWNKKPTLKYKNLKLSLLYGKRTGSSSCWVWPFFTILGKRKISRK